MNRETFINDNKAILNRDFYLYLLQKEIDAKKYKEVIDKLENKIKVVKQYDFDRVGRYELLDILKEVSE